MFNKRLASILLIVILLLESGCWDRGELERRGFIVGVAIDEGTKSVDNKQDDGKQIFNVTFEEVIPAGLKGTAQSGKQKGSKAYFNTSIEGSTMMSIIAEMSAMNSRAPFFEHLKLIVISDKVAKTDFGFANVLDFFIRNNDARRSVSVMIAKGEAKSIFEIEPKVEDTPVFYAQYVSRNEESYRMVPETRIGNVHRYLLQHESFILQKIAKEGNHISLFGAAVMNGIQNNMVGWLNDQETEGYNLLNGTHSQGVLVAKIGDNLVAYKIENIKKRISAQLSHPQHLQFTIHLELEGSMLEAFERRNFLKQSTLFSIEEEINATIVKLTDQAIQRLHGEYKKDVLGFGDYLHAYHPALWERVEDEWDQGANYFAKCKITVVPHVIIRRIGSVNNTEER